MKPLLNSRTLIWALNDDFWLSKDTKSYILNPDHLAYYDNEAFIVLV